MHHPGLNVRPAPGAFDKAREAAEESVDWLSQIRPEHLEGFWYNGTLHTTPSPEENQALLLIVASRSNLVLLGTFITLLQAVAFTSTDRDTLKKLFERLKWQLRIFSRGNELFEGALKRVDEKRMWVENVLEKGFTPIRPVARPMGQQRLAPPFVPAAGASGAIAPSAGFPEFGGHSMEELLRTSSKGMADGRVGNPGEFPDGFLGFEEFSGWDGFDIQHL